MSLCVLHSVLETSVFSRRADALLSREERADLIATLAANPLAGAVVPELEGVRKLRFAPKGRGKSGAFRAIYYLLSDAEPIPDLWQERTGQPDAGADAGDSGRREGIQSRSSDGGRKAKARR
jgi:Mg-chelatase subunit ChlI